MESQKSSMEILSELFGTFDAEPPLIIKKEKSEKHKKSKKKHKHKDKKHKKKDKKRKHSDAESSPDSQFDLAEILIKNEKEMSEKRIKIEKEDAPEIKTEKVESTIKEIQEKVSKDEGELSKKKSESPKEKHKKKKKHSSESKKRKRSKSRDSERKSKFDDSKLKSDDSQHRSKERERLRSRSRDKEKERKRSKERDRNKYRDRSREKYKYEKKVDDHRNSRDGKSYYRDEVDRHRIYEREREDKWFSRDRYKEHRDDRDHLIRQRESSTDPNSRHIDKKKLLEIARRNAIQMMKSGGLPTRGNAHEKMLAAIKAGGQTIEELTDFCKTLSKQEEEAADEEEIEERGSDSDENDRPFHHPFQIRDRPTSITMNIKNSVPLPIKSTQERSSELRMQFPVSSGQQHRKTEQWVPVSPKKSEKPPAPPSTLDTGASTSETVPVPPVEENPTQLVVPAPPNAPPGPQAFPTPLLEPTVDIGSIVSQRLTAMRRLQENPNDVQALTQIYKSNKEMQSWAESKQQPGQFTGTTGAQILSQAELASGYQAWAKKDQLVTAAPVSGGMGMHLLQKMGWRPGEGLGKEKSGALEPLLLQVKLDKRGLVADEEQPKKKKTKSGNGAATAAAATATAAKTMAGKHPVSLLGEYASKKKLGAPQYVLCFECGPDHKKNFLFKVILNGVEYQPNVASANKKDAKAAAAQLCLKSIGLIQ
ncbi:protein Son isoform X2 [Aethina tumida]|uniref:protein Son isoform X2 n=1 Tax=Aethina tumida TaxID=116153 RepID=UPI0021477853|nr:protein Son isoform X2 [Aethina tumida]